MPHYKDGTEAKVGDQVVGQLYNTPGVRAGTIVSITPGQESCNAMVGFLVAVPRAEYKPDDRAVSGSPIRMAVPFDSGSAWIRNREIRGEQHGTSGAEFMLVECADYCAVNELTKVG